MPPAINHGLTFNCWSTLISAITIFSIFLAVEMNGTLSVSLCILLRHTPPIRTTCSQISAGSKSARDSPVLSSTYMPCIYIIMNGGVLPIEQRALLNLKCSTVLVTTPGRGSSGRTMRRKSGTIQTLRHAIATYIFPLRVVSSVQ